MLDQPVPFSVRFSLQSTAALIRDDAPLAFRQTVLRQLIAVFVVTSDVVAMVQAATGQLAPNVSLLHNPATANATAMIEQCPWPQVFEVAELGYAAIQGSILHSHRLGSYERAINAACHANHLGWHMENGHFNVRGTEAEEASLNTTIELLRNSGKVTSASELQKARDDLSRLPKPDLTGAIQHAGAAIECLARDVTNNPKATFGDIIKANPQIFPGALMKVAQGVWGFVSNQGRHLEEGGEPTLEEALMLVGLVAALTGFLTGQLSEGCRQNRVD